MESVTRGANVQHDILGDACHGSPRWISGRSIRPEEVAPSLHGLPHRRHTCLPRQRAQRAVLRHSSTAIYIRAWSGKLTTNICLKRKTSLNRNNIFFISGSCIRLRQRIRRPMVCAIRAYNSSRDLDNRQSTWDTTCVPSWYYPLSTQACSARMAVDILCVQ
jgi:hypothetical protein